MILLDFLHLDRHQLKEPLNFQKKNINAMIDGIYRIPNIVAVY